jgi:hypothetical protein
VNLSSRIPLMLATSVLASTAALAAMSPAQKAVVDVQMATAAKADPAFKGFSADRGKAFFTGTHTGGKPDTPACTTCHTTDLTKEGKTRAGKPIEPMAASINPKRYTDLVEVEKWFKRNCSDVLGRECTAAEKGDVLTYLLTL